MDWEKKRTREISREAKFGWQCAASLALGLVLWGLSAAPFPWAQAAFDRAVTVMEEDTDWDEINRLSFVSNLFPQVQSVFSPQETPILLRRPVAGDMALGTDSLGFLCEEATVSACADGRVFYAGEDRVYLLHDNGYQTRLTGLVPSVRAGEKLSAGDPVGSVAPGDMLTLTLLQDGRMLDALDYLADPA